MIKELQVCDYFINIGYLLININIYLINYLFINMRSVPVFPLLQHVQKKGLLIYSILILMATLSMLNFIVNPFMAVSVSP